MAWAGLALAAAVAKTEADSVIGDATPSGQYTTGNIYGFGQLTKPVSLPASTLNAWAQASHQFADLWLWLLAQAGFDVIFVAGYFGLGLTLVIGSSLGGQAGLPGTLRRWWALAVLAAVNLTQAILSVVAFIGWIRPHRDVPVSLSIGLQVAVIAKWLLVIVLAAVAAYRIAGSPDVQGQLALTGRALKKQRFSLVIVTLLALIAIGKGTDVLEQMPDVQRAWLTWPPSLGWAHLAFAALAQILLAVLLALLGVMRTQRAQAAGNSADGRDIYGWRPWLLIVVTVPAIAVVARYAGVATVAWGNVIPIPGLALLAVIASWVCRKTAGDAAAALSGPVTAAQDASQERFVGTVAATGTMLAVAVIAVTGLGLVRSFTAAAMVLGGPYRWAFGIAVAAGFAIATVPWLVARAPAEWLARRFACQFHSTGQGQDRRLATILPRRAPGHGTPSPVRLLAISALPFAVADVLLVFEPMGTTRWLGVLATTVIAIGTLAVGLAVLAYLAQSRKPLPVFTHLLHLKSTPAISLVLVAVVVGTLLGKSAQLHDIRVPAAVAADKATVPASASSVLADGLRDWLGTEVAAGCALPAGSAPGGRAVQVAPLVLVAAAGGGIRAAWWTVQAMARIDDKKTCGEDSVFAASGVSGGSLGLAVTDTTADPRAALNEVAGPDGLAAAIDGLVLRDTIAGLTGLDLTAASMPPGQRFPDRAGLLEQAWQDEDSALAKPFPLSVPQMTWRLLMNTTAVGTGCRAVIADRLLAASPPSSGLSCDVNAATPIPDSYDFFASFPCLRGISTVTAALLSARFPYVTPSGVVNACGKTEQYVDGGYADSTGLATIAGLLPDLMSAVRQLNANAMASPASGGTVTLIVPVTAYLGNSPQSEPVTGASPGSPPQLLVPVSSGASGAQTQLSGSASLLQQISGEMSASQWLTCAEDDQKCAQAQAAAVSAVPQQLILVVPRKYPAVATPLGWVLSSGTRAELTQGVATEAASRCLDPAENEPYCPAHIGRLGDLLRLLSRTPVP